MSRITLQDIFNAAWQAFIVEDKPPAVEGGHCRYLTLDGKKCAVGLCLPEGHPAQNYLSCFSEMIEMWPELFDLPEHKTKLYFDTFQCLLHDTLQEDGEWRYSLEERKKRYVAVAKHYGLEVPALKGEGE